MLCGEFGSHGVGVRGGDGTRVDQPGPIDAKLGSLAELDYRYRCARCRIGAADVGGMSDIASMDANVDQIVAVAIRQRGEPTYKALLAVIESRRARSDDVDLPSGDRRRGEPTLGIHRELSRFAVIPAGKAARDVSRRRTLEEEHPVGRSRIFQADEWGKGPGADMQRS